MTSAVLAVALSTTGCTAESPNEASPLVAHTEVPLALPWGKVVDIEVSMTLFFQYDSGEVVALGDSSYAQSGIPEKAGYVVLEPTLVPTIHGVEKLFAGGRHTMALTPTGLWGWGTADYYELAQTDVWTAVEPVQVILPGKARALSLTGTTVGAILEDGSLWTWGQIGFPEADPTPKRVDGLPPMDRFLNLWWLFSCAVDQQDQAWCWGDEEEFQARLRNPPVTPTLVPVRVPEWDRAVQVGTAIDATLVLLDDGTVVGRGENQAFSLGTGDDEAHEEYIKIALDEPIVKLSVSSISTCVLSSPGNVFCWGQNVQHELGTGDNLPRKTPTRVEGLDLVVDLESASAGRCALEDDGDVICWGGSPAGWSPVPTKVDLPSLLRAP